MPIVESRPVATSIRVDHEHTLEMRADIATKTAEVENVTTGEMYTGGGGDSDFSTAVVTISFGENIGNTSITIPAVVETPYKGSLAFTLQTSAGAPATEETITAILYKNKCLCQCVTALGVIRTTGNITESGGVITIAGDGTIEVVAEAET